MSAGKPGPRARQTRVLPGRAELLAASPFGGMGRGVERIVPLLVEKRLRSGTVVFEEGESGGGFFILEEGCVRVFRTLPSGREITIFALRPGASFGFLPLLDGGPFPVSVAATEPSSLLVLDRRDFQKLLRAEPELSLGLLGHLASRLRECFDQLGMLGQPGTVARAAHGLLSFVSKEDGNAEMASVTLPFSQEELARVLHVTPENLSRAFTKLRRRGLLERLGPRRFRIPSLEALRAAADGD